MVKWANDGLLQAHDGLLQAKDGEMLVNDELVKWIYDHILISPSLTSILLSFVHLTIIKKLHRLTHKASISFEKSKVINCVDENLYVTFVDSQDMIPTVGFNMRKISKGSVTIKLWDIGKGRPKK